MEQILMVIENENKKTRVANVSASDRALLLKITNNYKNIIENKKTDNQTWKQKEKCWNKVQDEFNSSTAGPSRTAKQLKYKYESIKRDLKKKHAMHSAYMGGTGGGPYIPPPSPPKTTEERILSQTISLSIEGLSSKYDSDGVAGVSGLNYTQSTNKENLEGIEIDWTEPNCDLLQTEKRAVLKPPTQNEVEHNYSAILEPLTQNDLEHNHTEEHGHETVTGCSVEKTPQPWHSRRRPVLPKKKCLSSAGAKFEILATKKGELVAIQKDIIQEQRVQQREEHNKRLILLDLQIEEQKLKNQILLQQLNNGIE